MQARVVSAAAAVWLAAASPAAAERPLFRVNSEQATPGAFHPSGPLLTAVLRAVEADDQQELRNCSVEKHTRGLGPFFLVRRIRGAGRDLYFVRGSVQPFCMALFGAHAFRWYLLRAEPGRRFTLIHAGGGDEFAVFPARGHRLNDIESAYCHADECERSRLAWNGTAYKPVRCWTDTFTGRGSVHRPRRCDEE